MDRDKSLSKETDDSERLEELLQEFLNEVGMF